MPVPVERDDDAYFAPLAGLRTHAGTMIHLGLIHDQDGPDGTARRMATANRWLDRIENPQEVMAAQMRRASILAAQGQVDEALKLLREIDA